MVRTIVFLLMSIIALGVVATPGLALVGVFLLPFLFLGAAGWWIALAVTTRGRPSAIVVRTARPRLLGPGGPDDSFADVPYDEDVDRKPLDVREGLSSAEERRSARPTVESRGLQ
jgi:hypothetical protein